MTILTSSSEDTGNEADSLRSHTGVHRNKWTQCYIISVNRRQGQPNDGFLPNALTRYSRLSGVLLKLCRFLSVRSFLGNCSLPEFIRAFLSISRKLPFRKS